MLDTIRPFISSINSLDSNTIIDFSEPINKDSLIILGLENHNENIWENTEYINISPNSIQINNSKLFKIKILGSSVQDFNQNSILDSVKNGLGSYILSTNQGLMTDKDARAKNVGGEILCEVF